MRMMRIDEPDTKALASYTVYGLARDVRDTVSSWTILCHCRRI